MNKINQAFFPISLSPHHTTTTTTYTQTDIFTLLFWAQGTNKNGDFRWKLNNGIFFRSLYLLYTYLCIFLSLQSTPMAFLNGKRKPRVPIQTLYQGKSSPKTRNFSREAPGKNTYILIWGKSKCTLSR